MTPAVQLCVLQELRKGAEAAVLLTHPSDTVADAAAVLAAAIAWCMRWVQYNKAQLSAAAALICVAQGCQFVMLVA